ncbi:Elongator complex protein [Coemansia sp. RSA 2706]|nr:Elongator complex protein [Coemansia sp. RSA 2706]KAJ2318339.1 Elongator complex protein [Coemansia sp. RSA 2704]KAJ2388192.1 Elongator complex protein [Coemansia sp. RSA 2611]
MSVAAGLSIKRIAAHQQHAVPLVLLSETARQSALPLLEAMVRESLSHGLRVVAVCLEQVFSADIMRQPEVAPVDRRPLPAQIAAGSAFSLDGTRRIDIGQLRADICAKLEQTGAASTDSGGVLVVIDDLEPLLSVSRTATLALLRAIRSTVSRTQSSRVLARYPRDTTDQRASGGPGASFNTPLVSAMLCSIADAVIDVHHMDALDTWMPGWYSDGRAQPFVSLGDNDGRRGLVRLEHKRPSGKMGYEVAVFEIDERLRPTFTPIKAAAPAAATPEAPAAGDMGATQVPFNLELTEKQRQDRAGVELPYLEAQAGEIYYQLDNEDDWDDEDPDDDLEI